MIANSSQQQAVITRVELSASARFVGGIIGNRVFIREVNQKGQLFLLNTFSLPDTPSEFRFSPDESMFLVCLPKKNMVIVYPVNQEKSPQHLVKFQDPVNGILNAVWVPKSLEILAISDFQAKATVYSLDSEALSKPRPYIKNPKFTHKGFTFSKNPALQTLFAIIQRRDTKDYISIYQPSREWNLLNCIYVDVFDLWDLVWSPNNHYIVAWDNCINYRIAVICPVMGILKRICPYEHGLGVKSVSYSLDSLFLSVGSFDEKVRVFNGVTWQLIGELNTVASFAASKNCRYYREVESQGQDSTLEYFESGTYKIACAKILPAQKCANGMPNQGIGMVETSGDSQYIAARNDNMPQTVWIYQMASLKLVAALNFMNTVKNLKWAPDEQPILCVTTGNNKVYFWRPQCTCIVANRTTQALSVEWPVSELILIKGRTDINTCRLPKILQI